MRPRLRRTAVVLAVLAALALALRLAATSYAEGRLERAREACREAIGPLDLGRLELPEVPDELNAASWLLRAAEANDAIPWDDRLGRLADTVAAEWEAGDLGLARQLLRGREEALALLSRARSTESSTFRIRYRDGFNAIIPDLITLVRVAKLPMVAGRLAIREGSPDVVVESVETLHATAASLCGESYLLTLLIGSAVDRLGTALLSERLAGGGLAEAELEAHRRALEARACGQDALRRALVAEAMLTDTAPAAEAAMWAHGGWKERLLGWAFGRPSSLLGTAASLELRRHMIDNLTLPFAEYDARWAAGELSPGFLARRYDFAAPNLVFGIGNVKATETAAELARAAVSAALTHRRTGRFPETLELAATSYAGEVPVYTRTEGAAELRAPRSEALWRQQHPEGTGQSFPPVFRWRVSG